MTRATQPGTARHIVALTPNPAIDRTLTLGRALEPGTPHRVDRVREAAGGTAAQPTLQDVRGALPPGWSLPG